jgi:peptide chain release factor 2
LIQLWKS